MTAATVTLAQFAAGGSVAERTMIVVAHPDDETIGLGAQLCRLDDALLVHVTDGAPRDGGDARAHGFVNIADYAAARQAELAAALRAGDAARLRRLALGIPDKESWHDLAGLALRIADLLRAEQPATVFTHAYEGGHPDHDAAAFAVRAACSLHDAPPAIIEMPFYHRRSTRFVTGEFLPGPLPQSRRTPGPMLPRTERLKCGSRPSGGPLDLAVEIPLAAEHRQRKRRMIDCFATQRWLLEQFDLSAERFRVAPDYDFREPPHPGELHYETLGWDIAGADWRRAAAKTLTSFRLASPA
jgi:LmbE family N-acetylglucosaminyl deacetylase